MSSELDLPQENLELPLLALRDGYLPPTINYETSDPECDLDYIPNRGIERAVDIALCNCIGFGSKNSALVVRHPRLGAA